MAHDLRPAQRASNGAYAMSLTRTRSIALLRGAVLWQAYVNLGDERPYSQDKARAAWRKWLETFCKREGVAEANVWRAVQPLCKDAYKASLTISVHSTRAD